VLMFAKGGMKCRSNWMMEHLYTPIAYYGDQYKRK